jgi:predicted anti-sigma-YlaC factor YlaD
MASEPLTCRELVELVTDYLERALPALDHARVQLHLARCPHCRAYLAQVCQTIGWLACLPTEGTAPDTRSRLGAMFRAWQRGVV